MSTSYPAAKDSLSNPASSNKLNSPSHSQQHSDLNDAVEAIETKVGVGASGQSPTNAKVLASTATGESLWTGAPRLTGVNDSNGNELLLLPATASAVNHIKINNSATGLSPIITAIGDDTNVSLFLRPQGQTASVVLADETNRRILTAASVATGVNAVTVTNAATGTPPIIEATGSDSAIDLNLKPKGTGKVQENGITLMPSGVILPYGGSAAPTGWLLCDGTAVSRTTYSALFTAISTNYGVGDGSTTFNLPNCKGRTLVGRDAAQTEFDVMGETGGAKTHTLTRAETPNITGSLTFHGSGTATVAAGSSGDLVASNTNTSYRPGGADTGGANSIGGVSLNVGGGGSHNNLQPYLVVTHIIKT